LAVRIYTAWSANFSDGRFDRHRGGGHPPTPAKAPCVRVADTLGVHKSTASRLASTLVHRGFLERRKRSLRLGPEVGRLELRALNSRDLVTIARKPMEVAVHGASEPTAMRTAGSAALDLLLKKSPFICPES
jgi:IclR helix-turn-helix domain